ncbi:MAG: tyrosine-type recombinase/integrase [Solirubrobacteraceae bacterium]
MFDAQHGRKVRRTFTSAAAAKGWRRDALVAVRTGKLAEAKPNTTLREVCEAWLADARTGIVRTGGGDPFKPSTLRRYETHLRLRVYPALGASSFYRVRRADLQDLVDRELAAGLAPATIGTMLGAIGAVYARAVQRDELDVSPAANVKLPAIRNGRTRFADRAEALELLAAVPEGDRPVWACAMYAGLRRGELMALPWQDVDLVEGTILVARGWDRDGPTTTKNRGRRRVGLTAGLREHLAAQRLRQAPAIELVFGTAPHRPFNPDRMQLRADAAWKAAGLERLTLHDCRHTFASFAIAAGVNAKALSTAMGHSSVAITYDRYGHLMPGNEAEAAGLIDAYLAAESG